MQNVTMKDYAKGFGANNRVPTSSFIQMRAPLKKNYFKK
jgi:hypothetical protein